MAVNWISVSPVSLKNPLNFILPEVKFSLSAVNVVGTGYLFTTVNALIRF
jgi:hypothetical protein